MTSYSKIFDPPLVEAADEAATKGTNRYRYTERAILVVNAALVTGRPVLVHGLSGTGKSSLARDVASVLGRRLESHVITGNTTVEDLKWQIDHVQRLALAHGQGTADELALANFVAPGALWWAFEPESAQIQHRRVFGTDRPSTDTGRRTVLLLDEIDKADPDLANALLEPLEEGTFTVPHLNDRVISRSAANDGPASPLIFVTTNQERRLPDAFLRRCLDLGLDYPSRSGMLAIATEKGLNTHFDEIWAALFGDGAKLTISTAEVLDTLQAYDELFDGDRDLIQDLQLVTAWKHGKAKPAEEVP
ncbi:MAG: AAA family ATPase [Acidimicrobiales bacterium]